MNTDLISVSKLFTEHLFRIPDYQRGYAWQDKQLKDFWTDIEQMEGDHPHYTGVLTFEEVPSETWSKWEDDKWIIEKKSFKPLHVVDGQQRLTTVVILLTTICESLKKGEQLNFENKEDILKKYVFVPKDSAVSGSFVFGYEKDNPSYEFLKTHIFARVSEKYSLNEATIYTKNLKSAKDFFTEKIKSVSKQQLERLFSKVTQRLLFNVFVMTREIDVHVTFETMNNRGIPLSDLELLKNRLIFLSTKFSVQDHERQQLRRTVNDAWKTAYHYLGKDSKRVLNDNFFLATHFSSFFIPYLATRGEHASRQLVSVHDRTENYKEFLLDKHFVQRRIHAEKASDRLTHKDVFDYAIDLKQSVKLYYTILTPGNSDYGDEEKIWLERLCRMTRVIPARAIIVLLLRLLAKESQAKARVALQKNLERFLFTASLVERGRARFEYDGIFDEYVSSFLRGDLEAGELAKRLENNADEMFKTLASDGGLSLSFREHDYYSWRSIRYFLFEYELSLKPKTKSARDKLDWNDFTTERYDEDYRTIEHILPQSTSDAYWRAKVASLEPKQRKALCSSLGNLLPLSVAKNASLGNKSFDIKKGDSKNKVGYRYGCYSEIEVAHEEEWGTEQIRDRGLRLLAFMEQRWDTSLGDENKKLSMLGLDFLRSPVAPG